MIRQHYLPLWLACERGVERPATPRRRCGRRADWVLELALMLVVAALLPRDEKRK
jgi:hypothetical protein